MIYIEKNTPPLFLISYARKNRSVHYDDASFRDNIKPLREELIKEQKGLCAYCCSRIDLKQSHIEHIEPRNKKDGTKSKRSLDYNNMVASCNSNNTCGNKKGNKYDEEKFISPLQKECETHFSYDPDGYIHGDDYTINLLNLNSYELIKARKATYKGVFDMSEEDVRLVFLSGSESLQPFFNVISWMLKNGLFSK